MTTRQHPRTLNEAFSKTADYASSITCYSRGDKAVRWACAASVLFVIGLLILESI